MKKLFLLLLSSLTASIVLAATPQEKTMLTKLTQEFPKLNVEEVDFLPNVNLFELHMKSNTNLAYTNPSVDYFILAGEIIDAKSKKSITTEREAANVKRVFTNLPINKAIVVKYGKGTRKVAVFTDPDCPFCKASDQDFHKNLKNKDITFYYFMNPLRIQGHEEAPLKARKIWCAGDKSKAWVDWIDSGVLPNNPGTCPNPVAETKELGTSLTFNSTPSFIFDSGYIWRGQLMSDQLIQILNKTPNK